jgi:hypothetical protein
LGFGNRHCLAELLPFALSASGNQHFSAQAVRRSIRAPLPGIIGNRRGLLQQG